MKKLVTLLFFCYGINALSQTKFDVTFNQGYGQRPTYTDISDDDAISQMEADRLFLYLRDSTDLEFRYSYGGCEDRAHAMSLILKSKNIENSKIWNFDPYFISLFNSQQQLFSIDKSGLGQKVYWGYHVAPIIKVKSANNSELKVIDPSIASSVLSIEDWLKLQGASRSYYTFTDFDWFSFATINGFKFNDEPMPQNFPSLLTGDFYKNEGDNFTNQLVEEGLAVSAIAMIIIKDIIDNPSIIEEKKNVYRKLLLSISDLTNAMNNNYINPFTKKTDMFEFASYQKKYIKNKEYWKQVLDPLRN